MYFVFHFLVRLIWMPYIAVFSFRNSEHYLLFIFSLETRASGQFQKKGKALKMTERFIGFSCRHHATSFVISSDTGGRISLHTAVPSISWILFQLGFVCFCFSSCCLPAMREDTSPVRIFGLEFWNCKENIYTSKYCVNLWRRQGICWSEQSPMNVRTLRPLLLGQLIRVSMSNWE